MKIERIQVGKMKAFICLLALCGALALSRTARAADEGLVAVGGESIFRIRAAAEGKTITERREEVEDNLVPILSEPVLNAADVRVVPFGGNPKNPKTQRVRIEVKKHFLINVTPEDGRVNQLTALQQAKIWAKQLIDKLPRLNYRPNPNDLKP